MDRLVRARVLLAEAESLGVRLEDLAAVANSQPSGRRVPIVAEYVKIVEPVLCPRTAETYWSYWRLLIARYGDWRIDAVGPDECDEVVSDAVTRARMSKPECDGRSSKEHCITAMRAVFSRARRARLIVVDPTEALERPGRGSCRRRALEDSELTEVAGAVCTTSRDPELDLLLVRFHLITGARREGALNLTLGDLDPRRSTAWLDEKYGKVREQPIPPSLLAALDALARSRGATNDDDAVFRTKRHKPIVRKHYNTLFDKVQAVLPWTKRTPVTAHVLRYTAGTAVERLRGHAVAQAFLGHAPTTVTGVYTRATIHEVAAAVQALTGEIHPLTTAA